ncbi:mutator family transposase [Sinorhizobium medicae]|nr:mutator family transposase [Sinorhizobium medicae]
MAIEKELLDQLLAGRDPSEVFGKDGLLDDLKKALSERILNAELDDHLDVGRLEGGPANRRNGSSKKTVLTGTSKMTLTIPRDRAGTFDPKLIARYQRADSDEAAPLFRDDCAPGFRDDLAPCLVGSAGDDCCQFIRARCQALRGRFRRRLSPLNSMRWALWTNLSSMASA